MTIKAKLKFKLDAPVHVFGMATEVFNLNNLTEEDKADFIDKDRNKITTFINDIKIEIYLLYEFVNNPLVNGNQAAGIEKIEFELTNEEGIWEGEDSQSYRDQKKQYSELVFSVINRLVSYFKYEKENPFLRFVNVGHLQNWTWYDENDQVLYEVPKANILAHFPGLYGPLKSIGLRKSDLAKIGALLSTEPEVDVVDELMMHAREAIHEEACLLAILLLAVAVEVKVKTSFLGRDSATSDAFDFAQEKGKIAVSPVEFISKIASITFNESFEKTNKIDFENIDNLFRSRNKVAHRGKGIYNDKNAKLQTVDVATLNVWWKSVTTLFEWLSHKIV